MVPIVAQGRGVTFVCKIRSLAKIGPQSEWIKKYDMAPHFGIDYEIQRFSVTFSVRFKHSFVMFYLRQKRPIKIVSLFDARKESSVVSTTKNLVSEQKI